MLRAVGPARVEHVGGRLEPTDTLDKAPLAFEGGDINHKAPEDKIDLCSVLEIEPVSEVHACGSKRLVREIDSHSEARVWVTREAPYLSGSELIMNAFFTNTVPINPPEKKNLSPTHPSLLGLRLVVSGWPPFPGVQASIMRRFVARNVDTILPAQFLRAEFGAQKVRRDSTLVPVYLRPGNSKKLLVFEA
ncbi:hypothetical protein C8R43DRAFT_957682 [Mycena crocata]|nr:hypothetical protein C8R43DRAFT_957682 [Mycena crocata]